MILSPSNPFPISFVVGERIQGPHRALSAGFNSQTRPLLCGTNPARLTMVFIKTNSHKKYPHYPHYKPTGIVKRILIKSVFLSSGWGFWQSYTCNCDLNGLTNMATTGGATGMPTQILLGLHWWIGVILSKCLSGTLQESEFRVKYRGRLLMFSSVGGAQRAENVTDNWPVMMWSR